WKRWADKSYTTFQDCYTDNAVSESVDSTPPTTQGRAAIIEREKNFEKIYPDRRGELRLVLGSGTRLASVALFTATNEGPIPTPDGKSMPATKKKVGLLLAHTVELDATGSRAIRDAVYLDEAAIMSQLGVSKGPARKPMTPTGSAPTVAVGRNTPTESSNIATYRAWIDTLNKHDVKAFEQTMADDFVLTEMGNPADMKKKEAIATLQGYLKAFPDLTANLTTVWAAGDYVVAEGAYSGTNTGDMPAMGLKKTGKKINLRFIDIVRFENGKARENWTFANFASFATQLGMK
ncbi:MAG TPA: ester cyclase, partial [Vicinamibacterales bacterium]|nr:ester cyclase [Vicinamibacterales bacterium]